MNICTEINTSDEIEMMDYLECVGCKSSSSSDGITNEITPIQCNWNAPTVGVTELRDNNNTDMDVTIEYNKTINVSAIQMATSPDGLKESSATESFADAVLRSPGIHEPRILLSYVLVAHCISKILYMYAA